MSGMNLKPATRNAYLEFMEIMALIIAAVLVLYLVLPVNLKLSFISYTFAVLAPLFFLYGYLAEKNDDGAAVG